MLKIKLLSVWQTQKMYSETSTGQSQDPSSHIWFGEHM